MGCQWRADPPPGHRCESLPPLLLPSISHYAMHSPPSDITLDCHTQCAATNRLGRIPRISADFEVQCVNFGIAPDCDITELSSSQLSAVQ